MINPLDAATITLVAHGETDTLIRSGYRVELAEDPDTKVIFKHALELLHKPKPIIPNRVNLLAGTWGELRNPKEVKELISLNGKGEASAQIVAARCLERFIGNQTKSSISKYSAQLQANPHQASKILSGLTVELEQLNQSGQIYDPRPSAHKGTVIRPILFKSHIPTYNKIFEGNAHDGGGYRQGWWVVWMGTTGGGKSSHAYGMAADTLIQNRKVVFICKELQSQVRARVLLAMTGFTIPEVETEIAVSQEPVVDDDGSILVVKDYDGTVIGPWHEAPVRQKILNHHLDRIEENLRLYDWSFHKPQQVKSIISAEHPDMIMGDFYDITDGEGTDRVIGLGVLSRENEKIAHDNGIHFNGFFQIAGAERKAYMKNDNHEIVGPFGSSFATQFADTVLQTKWASRPYYQHTRRNKCRLGGLVESWLMPYDKARWVFR